MLLELGVVALHLLQPFPLHLSLLFLVLFPQVLSELAMQCLLYCKLLLTLFSLVFFLLTLKLANLELLLYCKLALYQVFILLSKG